MEDDRLEQILAAVHGGPPAHGIPDASVEQLRGHLRALSFADCQQLDHRWRSYSDYGLGPGWRGRTPSSIAAWPASLWPFAACASCSYDGYIREAAVARLAEASDPAVLPFLLLRTTDWVPAIAHHALGLVRERIDLAHVDRWIDAWPYLGRRLRGGTGNLREPVLALLLSPEARPSLVRALRSGSPAARDALAAVLDRLDVAGNLDLVELAMRSPDPSLVTRAVRARLAQLIATDAPDPERRAVAEAIYRARRGKARALALATWFATAAGPDAATVREALLDGASEVRELARFDVKRRQMEIDLVALARAATETGSFRERARAVIILAEAGERRPEVFAAFAATQHPARVREAGYLVLDKLGVYLDDEVLVTLLEGPSLRMARVAGRLLHRRGMSPPALSRVRELAAAASAQLHTRQLALALLHSVPVPRGQPH